MSNAPRTGDVVQNSSKLCAVVEKAKNQYREASIPFGAKSIRYLCVEKMDWIVGINGFVRLVPEQAERNPAGIGRTPTTPGPLNI